MSEVQGNRTIKIIGAFKLIKGLLLIALALGAFTLLKSNWENALTVLTRNFRVDPSNKHFRWLMTKVVGLSLKLPLILIGALLYHNPLPFAEFLGHYLRTESDSQGTGRHRWSDSDAFASISGSKLPDFPGCSATARTYSVFGHSPPVAIEMTLILFHLRCGHISGRRRFPTSAIMRAAKMTIARIGMARNSTQAASAATTCPRIM